jgi:hypothetical protein
MALELRRNPSDLPRLTLTEFWSRRQLIREVEPMTEEAYRRMEDEQWRAAFDTGHGEPGTSPFMAPSSPAMTRTGARGPRCTG